MAALGTRRVSPRGYLDAVARAGGRPVLVDPIGDPTGILDRVDALVLTGGPDVDPAPLRPGAAPERPTASNRADDDFEFALADDALARGVPTLAICRGFQMLNVALRRHAVPAHPRAIPASSRTAGPASPTAARAARGRRSSRARCSPKVMGTTTRRPRRAITTRRSTELGDGLRVVARADDGIVEGARARRARRLAPRGAVAPRGHRRDRPRAPTPLRRAGSRTGVNDGDAPGWIR